MKMDYVIVEAVDFGETLTGDDGKVLTFDTADAAQAHLDTLPLSPEGWRTHIVSWRVTEKP